MCVHHDGAVGPSLWAGFDEGFDMGASVARWWIRPARCSARVGTTATAASVPATMTACWTSASKVFSVKASASLRTCYLGQAHTCPHPAAASFLGAG